MMDKDIFFWMAIRFIISNLNDERHASGVEDSRFDTVIQQSTKIDTHIFVQPL
jgi:hypothetical protein